MWVKKRSGADTTVSFHSKRAQPLKWTHVWQSLLSEVNALNISNFYLLSSLPPPPPRALGEMWGSLDKKWGSSWQGHKAQSCLHFQHQLQQQDKCRCDSFHNVHIPRLCSPHHLLYCPFKAQWAPHMPPALAFNSSLFCLHSSFMFYDSTIRPGNFCFHNINSRCL